MDRQRFPPGFVFGTATSAQQIEGGRHREGRADSIWDHFAALPGRIVDGSNPDVACDHHRLWRSDVALMRELGLRAYRFSIAWPRVVPMGRGAVNGKGLDFYERLVDALLEADIEPYPTLYHWDLPQSLEDAGGWADRGTAEAFVAYTSAVVRRLGDRIAKWVTHNEPWCAATLGYEEGKHAPGCKDPASALRAAHHLLLSHGWASAEIRRLAPASQVGIVLIHCPAHAASDSPADTDAARWFDGFFNRWYLDPLYRGSYPTDAIADRVAAGHLESAELPFVQPGDLKAIAAPMDFLGLNYYSRVIMRSAEHGKPTAVDVAPQAARTTMGWEIYPEGMRESLLRVQRDYRPAAIYITENGAAFVDEVGADGRIDDARRIQYLHDHLLAVQEAMAAGVPVRGYFAWTLMDNFEWGYGYGQRFGLVAVEPESLARKPKRSAEWYRATIQMNSVAALDEPKEGAIRGRDS